MITVMVWILQIGAYITVIVMCGIILYLCFGFLYQVCKTIYTIIFK